MHVRCHIYRSELCSGATLSRGSQLQVRNTPMCPHPHGERRPCCEVADLYQPSVKTWVFFVHKERRYVHERSDQKKALRVGGIDNLVASFDSSHQTMTQLSDEICSLSPHYPQAHPSSLILDGLESPSSPSPSDVAQPSVVELAWFNAAGTRAAYCARSCSAAGSRQKPHCEGL